MDEKRPRARGVTNEIRDNARALRKRMTPAEEILWEALRRGRLQDLRFRKQHPFETFIFDFYCAEHKLIVEVDGSIHNTPDVAGHDVERDAYLHARGFRILRFRNIQVRQDLASVQAAILEATREPLQIKPE
jgi:very-short-patch-repair endonuclease